MCVHAEGLCERPAVLTTQRLTVTRQGTSGYSRLKSYSSPAGLHSGAIMVRQPKPTKGVEMVVYKQKFVEWAKKVFEEENETNPEMEGAPMVSFEMMTARLKDGTPVIIHTEADTENDGSAYLNWSELEKAFGDVTPKGTALIQVSNLDGELTVTRLTDGEKDYVDYFVDCNEQYSKDDVVEGTLKIELK